MRYSKIAFLVVALFLHGCKELPQKREQIRIVGSTSVYTFATFVAEYFGHTTDYRTPILEATGTGGGINIFCTGTGVQHPDIVNASRRMTRSEKKMCRENGVLGLVEVKIGYDGIVLGANIDRATYNLTREEIYLALGAEILKEGKWIPNPYKQWNEINPKLPNKKIMVLGPTTTLAAREVFEDLVIKKGCLSHTKGSKKCTRHLREDGAFVEVAEHENVIVQRLEMNPDAYGIFSFGFLDQNKNKVHAMSIEGIKPTQRTIASHTYPISRPLYFYAKRQHLELIPGLDDYIKEFISDRATGPDGYLTDKGLIPLQQEEKKKWARRILRKI